MYAAMDGPKIAAQGPAYIHVDLDVSVIPLEKPSSGTFNVSVMFYRSVVLDYGVAENLNICSERPVVPKTFTDVEVVSFPVSPSGDGEGFTASVVAHREIADSGLQHCFIQVCPVMEVYQLAASGSLDFRNPYGFLPGADYGRTTSRFMLLMICLGYGITRISLEKREMTSVVALTAAFLGSGILQLASSVASASSLGKYAEYETYNPLLAVPALLFDVIFLSWIYGQLSNMLKELKEVNETYKYKMYRALAWTLGTFVTLFTTLTVVMLSAEGSQTQSWEWKFEWINVVSWEILNFCMLCAVSVIWRPSDRSALLAYSKQLATTEVGAEEADGIEMDTVEFQGPAGGQFTIGDEEEQEEIAEEHGFDEGKVDGKGSFGVYTEFEPQRHTDLT
eukprot:g8944.t1